MKFVKLLKPHRSSPGAARERGVVLFVALIVLVIMALTGIAMIRQSGAGLSIAGNLGMRQNALSGADLGTEAAMAWWLPILRTTPAVLDVSNPAQGYYADWGSAIEPERLLGDPTKYDWSNAKSFKVVDDDGTGNEVRYVIERLCLNGGVASAAGQQCVQIPIKDGNDMSGTCDNYPRACPPPATTVQFRVSSRSKGPRSTYSYIQVMLTATS